MNAKIYGSVILIFGLFVLFPVKAEADTLPNCAGTICSDIFHNKKIGKATLVVWEGEGDIITSRTFDLDSSAVLASSSGIVSSESYSTANNAPPPPCSSGACSTSRPVTYETATEIVTVTVTFVYFNGELVDVTTSERRTNKPPQIEK